MDNNPLNDFADALLSRWWIWVVRGVAAILFGILAFASPGSSLLALVYVWGAYAVADGVFALMIAAQRGNAGLRWGWMFFQGLIGIGAGITTFVWPAITAVALLGVIAAWAFLTGVAEIAASIALRREIRGEWLLALSGVLSIAFSALLVFRPDAGALAIVSLIGAYAVLLGVLLMSVGFRLNSWRRSLDRQPTSA
jgi:uncharacterized membrane protein HdeD (DUF308 family)